ncbi:uncharacterized protein LOC108949337 isoform X2 [Ciona intestinalis]
MKTWGKDITGIKIPDTAIDFYRTETNIENDNDFLDKLHGKEVKEVISVPFSPGNQFTKYREWSTKPELPRLKVELNWKSCDKKKKDCKISKSDNLSCKTHTAEGKEKKQEFETCCKDIKKKLNSLQKESEKFLEFEKFEEKKQKSWDNICGTVSVKREEKVKETLRRRKSIPVSLVGATFSDNINRGELEPRSENKMEVKGYLSKYLDLQRTRGKTFTKVKVAPEKKNDEVKIKLRSSCSDSAFMEVTIPPVLKVGKRRSLSPRKTPQTGGSLSNVSEATNSKSDVKMENDIMKNPPERELHIVEAWPEVGAENSKIETKVSKLSTPKRNPTPEHKDFTPESSKMKKKQKENISATKNKATSDFKLTRANQQKMTEFLQETKEEFHILSSRAKSNPGFCENKTNVQEDFNLSTPAIKYSTKVNSASSYDDWLCTPNSSYYDRCESDMSIHLNGEETPLHIGRNISSVCKAEDATPTISTSANLFQENPKIEELHGDNKSEDKGIGETQNISYFDPHTLGICDDTVGERSKSVEKRDGPCLETNREITTLGQCEITTTVASFEKNNEVLEIDCNSGVSETMGSIGSENEDSKVEVGEDKRCFQVPDVVKVRGVESEDASEHSYTACDDVFVKYEAKYNKDDDYKCESGGDGCYVTVGDNHNAMDSNDLEVTAEDDESLVIRESDDERKSPGSLKPQTIQSLSSEQEKTSVKAGAEESGNNNKGFISVGGEVDNTASVEDSLSKVILEEGETVKEEIKAGKPDFNEITGAGASGLSLKAEVGKTEDRVEKAKSPNHGMTSQRNATIRSNNLLNTVYEHSMETLHCVSIPNQVPGTPKAVRSNAKKKQNNQQQNKREVLVDIKPSSSDIGKEKLKYLHLNFDKTYKVRLLRKESNIGNKVHRERKERELTVGAPRVITLTSQHKNMETRPNSQESSKSGMFNFPRPRRNSIIEFLQRRLGSAGIKESKKKPLPPIQTTSKVCETRDNTPERVKGENKVEETLKVFPEKVHLRCRYSRESTPVSPQCYVHENFNDKPTKRFEQRMNLVAHKRMSPIANKETYNILDKTPLKKKIEELRALRSIKSKPNSMLAVLNMAGDMLTQENVDQGISEEKTYKKSVPGIAKLRQKMLPDISKPSKVSPNHPQATCKCTHTNEQSTSFTERDATNIENTTFRPLTRLQQLRSETPLYPSVMRELGSQQVIEWSDKLGNVFHVTTEDGKYGKISSTKDMKPLRSLVEQTTSKRVDRNSERGPDVIKDRRTLAQKAWGGLDSNKEDKKIQTTVPNSPHRKPTKKKRRSRPEGRGQVFVVYTNGDGKRVSFKC